MVQKYVNIDCIKICLFLGDFMCIEKKKVDERKELINIFNSLTPALKQQLLLNAKVVLNTQNILLRECDNKKKANKTIVR